MKCFPFFLLIIVLPACRVNNKTITPAGEANFRISYTNHSDTLTATGSDSWENSKPTYSGTGTGNRLYELLVKKGIISNNALDTSRLALQPLNAGTTEVHFQGLIVRLEPGTTGNHQYLAITSRSGNYTVDLGESLLGDRWVCLLDTDSHPGKELLLLEKYYIMGGDNFDLKVYTL